MTPPTEQIRAVLESKGYIECNSCGEKDCGFYNHSIKASVHAVDLFDSLDACFETFEKDAGVGYWVWLMNVCGVRDGAENMVNIILVAKATCAQRIEAYLRDKGLWKD